MVITTCSSINMLHHSPGIQSRQVKVSHLSDLFANHRHTRHFSSTLGMNHMSYVNCPIHLRALFKFVFIEAVHCLYTLLFHCFCLVVKGNARYLQ